jgi:enoyl-CoA hydratase/carnithine racemase
MGVSIETVGEAAVVTLRWPEQRNALGPAEAREVAEAIAEAGSARPGAVVLTGEGAFCAGGDLRTFAELSARYEPAQIRERVYGNVQAMIRNLRDAPAPTIAAVDGPAVGLGMDLALACDVCFVGPQGWMRQGWGRAGLISATAGTWFLERNRRGSIWPLLAEQPRIGQAEAVATGLAEAGEPSAREAAVARAEMLAAQAPGTLAAYADLARRANWPDDDYLDRCADYQSEFIGSQRFRDLSARMLEAAERQ